MISRSEVFSELESNCNSALRCQMLTKLMLMLFSENGDGAKKGFIDLAKPPAVIEAAQAAFEREGVNLC